jgi:hypothetical protein
MKLVSMLQVRGEICWRKESEGDHLADIGVNWRIILNWVFNNYNGGMDWINLAQNGEE